MNTMPKQIQEYPFTGSFYRQTDGDVSVPLNERESSEELVLTTVCDIQEASHSMSRDFIEASYAVYFPFDGIVLVRRSDLFRGEMYGMDIIGTVIGVFPSQLGGCKVYIKSLEEE